MPIHHPLRPGVDCAPDEFDSFEAMGVMPIPRLPERQRTPWVGVERRRHMLNERVNPATPFPEVRVEQGAAVEADALTLSRCTPAVEAGSVSSQQQSSIGPVGACGALLVRVSTHQRECPDASLTGAPLEVGADPVNEGVT